MLFSRRIAVAALVFLAARVVVADDADDQLNAAYHQALAGGRVRPAELKWEEEHWLVYRDAEANLQAWIAGGTHPDEAARAASLARTTATRTNELRALAQTGPPANAPPTTSALPGADGATPDNLTDDDAYRALKTAAISRHDPQLLAALILDQKAWLQFSQLQRDFESVPGAAPRQDSLVRWRADAAALGVPLPRTSSGTDDPFGDTDLDTEVSPDHLLRIEQSGGQGWLISNQTGQRALLPQKQDEAGVGRSTPTVLVSEYAISPDDAWIFRTQKFYHGMCGAYLYHRVSGLTYRAATPKPLDILAWHFFEQTTHMSLFNSAEGGVVRFVAWPPGQLRISLNAKETLIHGFVADWIVDYDFAKGRFSIPTDHRESDRHAFHP
jgi:uncharacterized protein YecT (DUF1311 family)